MFLVCIYIIGFNQIAVKLAESAMMGKGEHVWDYVTAVTQASYCVTAVTQASYYVTAVAQASYCVTSVTQASYKVTEVTQAS